MENKLIWQWARMAMGRDGNAVCCVLSSCFCKFGGLRI